MTGKFYYEIADQLLNDSTFQNYRRDLEHATDTFEDQVMAIFEVADVAVSGESMRSDVKKAFDSKADKDKKLDEIKFKLEKKFKSNNMGGASWGKALHDTAKKILDGKDYDLKNDINNFVFALLFNRFISKHIEKFISDEATYKKAISSFENPLQMRNLLLEKTDVNGLYSIFLQLLSLDAFSQMAGKKQDLLEKMDLTGDAKSQLVSDAADKLEETIDELDNDKEIKNNLIEKAKQDHTAIPKIEELLGGAVFSAIQMQISRLLEKTSGIKDLIKENSDSEKYKAIIDEKLKSMDDPEKKQRFENIYNAFFLGKEPKKEAEKGKMKISNDIQKAVEVAGKEDEVYKVLSADLTGYMLSTISTAIKNHRLGAIKESNLPDLTQNYIAQLRRSLQQYRQKIETGPETEKPAAEEFIWQEGEFFKAIKQNELASDDAVLRIARYIYKYIISENENLKKMPENEIEKQMYDLIEEYIDQLSESKATVQHAMSIISTNTKNTKDWKQLLDKYSTPENRTELEKRFKVLLGDIYSSYLNKEEPPKGPTLTLNEAWKNLETIDKPTTDNIINGVWNAIEANRERIDKMIDVAYNKIIQPLRKKSQRNVGSTYQQKPEESPQEQPDKQVGTQFGMNKPENAEYTLPISINRLYTFEEFMVMKPYNELNAPGEPPEGEEEAFQAYGKAAYNPTLSKKKDTKSEIKTPSKTKTALKGALTGEEGQARAKAVRYTIASIILYSVGLVMQTINENVEAVETGKEEGTNEEYFAEFIIAAAATYLLGKALSPFIGNFLSQFGKMPDNFKDLDKATFEKAMRKAIEASEADKSGFKEALAGLGFDTVADGYNENLFSKEGLTEMLKDPENKKQFEDLVTKAIDGVKTQLGQISQKTIESMIEKTYQPSAGVAKGRAIAEKITKKIQGAKW